LASVNLPIPSRNLITGFLLAILFLSTFMSLGTFMKVYAASPPLGSSSANYPYTAYVGKAFQIDVFGNNLGGDATEGDLEIEFPSPITPSSISVSCCSATTGTIVVKNIGDTTNGANYGGPGVRVQYPLALVYRAPWQGGLGNHLYVTVAASQVGSFVFYAKLTMADQSGKWSASYSSPSNLCSSCVVDQQGEYAYKYTITVSNQGTSCGAANGDLYSLSACAITPSKTLLSRALLTSVSTGQTITVSAGSTVSFTAGYTISRGSNPSELDQLLFLPSWAGWPPSQYWGVFSGVPAAGGSAGSVPVSFTAPSSAGTYYLWLGFDANYGYAQAAGDFKNALSTPAYIKIIVSGPSRVSVTVYSIDLQYKGQDPATKTDLHGSIYNSYQNSASATTYTIFNVPVNTQVTFSVSSSPNGWSFANWWDDYGQIGSKNAPSLTINVGTSNHKVAAFFIVVQLIQVPYYDQNPTEWCVDTSTSMVVKYYGLTYPNYYIARDNKQGHDNGLSPYALWWYIDNPNPPVSNYISTTEPLNLGTIFGLDAQLGAIKASIDARNPVIAFTGDVKHTVVFVGYDSANRVYINDPSGALFTGGVDGNGNFYPGLQQKFPGKYDSVTFPYIAVPVDWNDFKAVAGGFLHGTTLMYISPRKGVSPAPPAASLSLVDFSVGVQHGSNPIDQDLYLDGTSSTGTVWNPISKFHTSQALDNNDVLSVDWSSVFKVEVFNNQASSQLYSARVRALNAKGSVLYSTSFQAQINGRTVYNLPRVDISLSDSSKYNSANGPYTLEIDVLDSAGSTVYDAVSLKFTITSSLVVTPISPPNGGTMSASSVTLKVRVTDSSSAQAVTSASVKIYLDGSLPTGCSGVTDNNGYFSCSVNLNLRGHTYSWYAVATKTPYPVGGSATWTFHRT
jgi:hypothetical protein